MVEIAEASWVAKIVAGDNSLDQSLPKTLNHPVLASNYQSSSPPAPNVRFLADSVQSW